MYPHNFRKGGVVVLPGDPLTRIHIDVQLSDGEVLAFNDFHRLSRKIDRCKTQSQIIHIEAYSSLVNIQRAKGRIDSLRKKFHGIIKLRSRGHIWSPFVSALDLDVGREAYVAVYIESREIDCVKDRGGPVFWICQAVGENCFERVDCIHLKRYFDGHKELREFNASGSEEPWSCSNFLKPFRHITVEDMAAEWKTVQLYY